VKHGGGDGGEVVVRFGGEVVVRFGCRRSPLRLIRYLDVGVDEEESKFDERESTFLKSRTGRGTVVPCDRNVSMRFCALLTTTML
jgi:hypothetical protein